MDFSGKVVLVTGASSGIGAAAAVEFFKRGASLVLTGRNMERLGQTEEQCRSASSESGEVLLIQADVTKESELEKVMEETINFFGKLNVLVNNVGVGLYGSIEDATLEEFDKIFNVNVRSVFHLTKLAVPHLIETKGNIVNVSSVLGSRPHPRTLAYCMSKATINHFTVCTALDLASKEIRVNSVNPGIILTQFFDNMGMTPEEKEAFLEGSKKTHALGRFGEPEEVAKVIVFVASDDASFMTGTCVTVDGGFTITPPQ